LTRKLYLKTYGCQMNAYDSARMADVLAPLGYTLSDEPDDADLILLNTCHIREKAAEKVYSELGRMRHVQDAKAAKGERTLLAVAGCVAQAEGEEILQRAPQVDVVVGPQTYHRLPELIAKAERSRSGRGILDTDFPVEDKFDHLPEERRPQGPSAYLSVQEGCDKFCTFCVVPYTRGAEVSRPVAEVLAEARQLVASGSHEIVLLGQNVSAYHGEGPDGREWGLGRLIRALAEIEGVERIRYTTSHPRDMDDELLTAHRDVPQLMPFLHLPVQSGSDRVLKAMNRGHTADHYRRIIERARELRPDLAVASDFIVGHPGERAEDHAETLRLAADIGFAHHFAFKYSPRPGTPAAMNTEEAVPDTVATERLHGLQQVLGEQGHAFNHRSVGMRLPVLFDGHGKRAGQLIGRSPYMQPVHVQAPDRLIGRTVEVEITEAHPNSLRGRVATATWDGASAHAAAGAGRSNVEERAAV